MPVAAGDTHMNSLSFRLRPVAPFRLDLTVWALRRRARNIVDRWDGSTYRRVFMVNGKPIEAAVVQSGPSHRPFLTVSVAGQPDFEVRKVLTELIIRVLGVRTNLEPFYELALGDRRLALLVEQFRGLKPPRFPSVFEALVNAIACQQLSLTVGVELLNRIAMHCGPTSSAAGVEQHAFPRAEDLVHLRPQANLCSPHCERPSRHDRRTGTVRGIG